MASLVGVFSSLSCGVCWCPLSLTSLRSRGSNISWCPQSTLQATKVRRPLPRAFLSLQVLNSTPIVSPKYHHLS